jgi:hypothetical protein
VGAKGVVVKRQELATDMTGPIEGSPGFVGRFGWLAGRAPDWRLTEVE